MIKKYTIDAKAVEIVVSHSKYQTVDLENHYAKHTHNLELIRDINVKNELLNIRTLIIPISKQGDRISLSTEIMDVKAENVVDVKLVINAVTVDLNKICGKHRFSSEQMTLESKAPDFNYYRASCKTGYSGLKKLVDHPEYETLKNSLASLITSEHINFVSALLKISVYFEAVTLYATEPFLIGALGLKVFLQLLEDFRYDMSQGSIDKSKYFSNYAYSYKYVILTSTLSLGFFGYRLYNSFNAPLALQSLFTKFEFKGFVGENVDLASTFINKIGYNGSKLYFGAVSSVYNGFVSNALESSKRTVEVIKELSKTIKKS
jgi:hypothetical protein